MLRRTAHRLTSIVSVLGMLLVVAAHGGIVPRFAAADSKNRQRPTNAPQRGEQTKEPGNDDGTSAPLDLINSLPSAMLIRVHTDEPSSAVKMRSSVASAVVARGGLDPARLDAAANAAPGGAYRLISLRRDAYLARPPIDPFAEARTPRDPALTSSISILGPPSA